MHFAALFHVQSCCLICPNRTKKSWTKCTGSNKYTEPLEPVGSNISYKSVTGKADKNYPKWTSWNWIGTSMTFDRDWNSWRIKAFQSALWQRMFTFKKNVTLGDSPKMTSLNTFKKRERETYVLTGYCCLIWEANDKKCNRFKRQWCKIKILEKKK